jgi:RimJ/RimL family protein N-acetyltransferase
MMPVERLRAFALRIVRLSPLYGMRRLRQAEISDPVVAPRIVTRRLVLRRHRLRDATGWYALQSDPAVIEHLRWPVRSRAASLEHLLHRTRHVRLAGADDFLALAVTLNGRMVGDVSLHLRKPDPQGRLVEIGWVIAPEHQGHGLAREAAAAMLELAFSRLRPRQVIARMDSANEPSRLLAERLKFTTVSDAGGSRLMALSAETYSKGSPPDAFSIGRQGIRQA